MKRLAIFVLLLVLVLGCCTTAFSYQDTYTFTFDLSDLAFTQERGFDKVTLAGATCFGEPGYPWLPMRTVQIAIPEWQEVQEVEVISANGVELPKKYRLYPVQPMVEISRMAQKIDFTPPNREAYSMTTEYPGKLAEVTNNGFLAGQHIAGFALYPLQYIPTEGKLILYTEIQLRLIFKPTTRYPVPVLYRSERTAQFYSDLASKMVINPQDILYQMKGSVKSGTEVEFLIIVPDSSYDSVLEDLADWKIRKGISTEILPYPALLADYMTGDDNEENIRDCIKDYYSTKGTKWVLIVGDTDLVPIRLAYWQRDAFGRNQYIPCQLYYSDLDGDWNADSDSLIGEFGDEVDMYPEVYLGRAPVDDVSEARSYVDKCLLYESGLQANSSDDYLNRVLFFAEYLGWADGRDIKDTIKIDILPGGFDLTELYQTDETLDTATLRLALNEGQNIINHAGHGTWNAISIRFDTSGHMLWENSHMASLDNDSLFGLFYSISCLSAAIDFSDCFAEYWVVKNADNGGIAYCGNTRSGWSYSGTSITGPSPEMDTSFFGMIFNEDIFQIGATLAESKVPYIPRAQMPYLSHAGVWRHVMYALLLLGDPTLELWTDTLDQLTVSHDLAVPSGAKSFVVDVQEDDALVNCVNLISGELTIMGTAYSSGGSAVVLFDSPAQLGNVIVTVTKHNYELYSDTLPILGFVPPEVVYYSHTADDSVGTENGVVNPGDSATVLVTLKNLGGTQADGVTAILTTADTLIDLDTAEVLFGLISGGSTAQGQSPWVFKVDPDCPDSHVVVFILDAKDKNDSSWVSGFELMVLKTDFTLTIDDSDTDTKGVTVGDSVDFILALDTTGGFNWQVKLAKLGRSPFGLVVTINPDTLTPPGQSTLRVKTTAFLSPDIYYITVTGASAAGGDSIYHDLTVTVFVEPSASPMLDTWYVSTVGDNSLGNGTEDLPFRTIQKGIDTASDGDTVMVERGVYEENIDFDGKDILVTSRYWPDSTEAAIESTIIDGTFKGPVVRFLSGESHTAHLLGFTIRNGYHCRGAGIYIDSSSSATIERNIITLNTLELDTACSRVGPGICCGRDSYARILRNLLYDNYGNAAIQAQAADSIEVINNTIVNNPKGGIAINGSAMFSCTTLVTIRNNIVSENGQYGIGIWSADSGEVVSSITFNDVWGHTSPGGDTTNYSGDLEDLTDTLGNISHDPLFDSVEIGDYHLSCYSPCIDSGDTADSVPPNGGSRIDMGAFEFEYTSTDTICGDLDYDGCVTWRDYYYLFDWMFYQGPDPVPECVADVNCSDDVDIGDLNYLLWYLRGTGNPPCDTCCAQ